MKGFRVAVLAIGLSLPAAAVQAGEAVNLTLNWTPTADHSPFYYAKAQGWYEDAGLDVRFIEPGEAGSLQALAGGKAQVAVSAQEELVPARAAGLPVRSIAAIIQHNTSSLVSLADDGIDRPKDRLMSSSGDCRCTPAACATC